MESQPNHNPKVTVVVPNYNYGRYLEARIRSIVDQTFDDLEIVILDDCSTDNSMQVIEQLRCCYPQISSIVKNDVNSGNPFAQWHKGLEMARGEYVWIAEADDLADAHFLERSVRALDKAANAAFAMSMSEIIDSDGKMRGDLNLDDCEPDGRVALYSGKALLDRQMAVDRNLCYNASMAVIRRSAWQKMGDYTYKDYQYCGDWLFWAMLMNVGGVVHIREKLNRYRVHGKSTTDAKVGGVRKLNPQLWNLKLRMIDNFGTPDRLTDRLIRYRIYREYRKGERASLDEAIREINPYFFAQLGVTSAKYPVLWLEKHLPACFHPKHIKYLNPIPKFID